eukprot:TRINITY_DN11268_c0_g1_i1.p1 TRINITY_DN11268_c0_g1~~TRINITY_DN11268_c0_g1_i1.p1  ORF type:complete len:594 (+),score=38.32 TRINITY_DN11268_c0_g1_i1:81-1862(+)
MLGAAGDKLLALIHALHPPVRPAIEAAAKGHVKAITLPRFRGRASPLQRRELLGWASSSLQFAPSNLLSLSPLTVDPDGGDGDDEGDSTSPDLRAARVERRRDNAAWARAVLSLTGSGSGGEEGSPRRARAQQRGAELEERETGTRRRGRGCGCAAVRPPPLLVGEAPAASASDEGESPVHRVMLDGPPDPAPGARSGSPVNQRRQQRPAQAPRQPQCPISPPPADGGEPSGINVRIATQRPRRTRSPPSSEGVPPPVTDAPHPPHVPSLWTPGLPTTHPTRGGLPHGAVRRTTNRLPSPPLTNPSGPATARPAAAVLIPLVRPASARLPADELCGGEDRPSVRRALWRLRPARPPEQHTVVPTQVMDTHAIVLAHVSPLFAPRKTRRPSPPPPPPEEVSRRQVRGLCGTVRRPSGESMWWERGLTRQSMAGRAARRLSAERRATLALRTRVSEASADLTPPSDPLVPRQSSLNEAGGSPAHDPAMPPRIPTMRVRADVPRRSLMKECTTDFVRNVAAVPRRGSRSPARLGSFRAPPQPTAPPHRPPRREGETVLSPGKTRMASFAAPQTLGMSCGSLGGSHCATPRRSPPAA